MLFNSYEFIFAFLPITFIIYFYLLNKRLIIGAKVFLVEPPKVNGSSLKSKKLPDFVYNLRDKYENLKVSDIYLSTYYPSQFFMDRGHLNYNGAKIYTEDILNSFKRAYGE